MGAARYYNTQVMARQAKTTAAAPSAGTPQAGTPQAGTPQEGVAAVGNPLLLALGQRIRRTREGLGLTVSELARRAGLSRRYVTEAEAGRANLSVLRLADLAVPLGVSLAHLCDLPLAARGERIALIGLRGAGKTSVGKLLAGTLDARFVELDERIEAQAGLSLAEIFDLHGVEAYRRYEREALEEVLTEGQRLVIATGGSIVTSEETYDRLRAMCRTVWLRAAPEAHLARVHAQGDRRPTAGRPRALEELREILGRRELRYALADFTLETDGLTSESVAAELVRALGRG